MPANKLIFMHPRVEHWLMNELIEHRHRISPYTNTLRERMHVPTIFGVPIITNPAVPEGQILIVPQRGAPADVCTTLSTQVLQEEDPLRAIYEAMNYIEAHDANYRLNNTYTNPEFRVDYPVGRAMAAHPDTRQWRVIHINARGRRC